jgi:hypothetical protein
MDGHLRTKSRAIRAFIYPSCSTASFWALSLPFSGLRQANYNGLLTAFDRLARFTAFERVLLLFFYVWRVWPSSPPVLPYVAATYVSGMFFCYCRAAARSQVKQIMRQRRTCQPGPSPGAEIQSKKVILVAIRFAVAGRLGNFVQTTILSTLWARTDLSGTLP